MEETPVITIDSETGTVTFDIDELHKLIARAQQPPIASGTIWTEKTDNGATPEPEPESPTIPRSDRIEDYMALTDKQRQQIAGLRSDLEKEREVVRALESAGILMPVSEPAPTPERATGAHVARGARRFESMDTAEFALIVDELMDDIHKLLLKKREAYGTKNLSTRGVDGIVIRASDKLRRLEQLTAKDAMTSADGESLLDTWKDLIGYGILGHIFSECAWLEGAAKDDPHG